MRQQYLKLFTNPLFLAGLLVFITAVITGQSLLLEHNTFQTDGIGHTHYNNYVIFKQSFFHLTGNKDLYQLYPAEHWDYYKYSPTFSLLMAPLAVLPDAAGLLTWNLLNVLVLGFALWKLPSRSDKSKLLLFCFILAELISSVQNSQSNGLIAGLTVFAFVLMEKKKIAWASLFIVLTIFIKIFGVVSLALFILYPGRVKALIYTVGWILLLAILPLLVVSFPQLSFLYHSWFSLLQQDQSVSWGLSVAGWLHSWFALDAKSPVLLMGVILFCLPFLKYKFFREIKFRLFFLSSALIWVVIFNYKAESPTYIIAVTGVTIWFFCQKLRVENIILLIGTLLLTVLSPTDIFPKSLRDDFVVPYTLKALPCILVWLKITYDLVFYRSENIFPGDVSDRELQPASGG